MRHPSEAPGVVHVVDPGGRIRAFAVAEGITNRIIDQEGKVRPEHKATGHVSLAALYKREGPKGGLAVYLDFCAAAKAGKETELDDRWLPPTVRKRRAAEPASKVWRSPPPPESDAQVG